MCISGSPCVTAAACAAVLCCCAVQLFITITGMFFSSWLGRYAHQKPLTEAFTINHECSPVQSYGIAVEEHPMRLLFTEAVDKSTQDRHRWGGG
jgi:hypothetical protein